MALPGRYQPYSPQWQAADGCFVVEDRGLKVKGEHVDIFTGSTAVTAILNDKVPSNQGVTVVVSAGTEEFTMPDVVGEGLTLARSQLEQKGLEVQVEPQPSDQPSDTVLGSNPAAAIALTHSCFANNPHRCSSTGLIRTFSPSRSR